MLIFSHNSPIILVTYIRATEVYVILGAHQSVDSPTYDPNRQYFRGSKWVIHPNWNINTLAADIALVKLNETAFTNGNHQ